MRVEGGSKWGEGPTCQRGCLLRSTKLAAGTVLRCWLGWPAWCMPGVGAWDGHSGLQHTPRACSLEHLPKISYLNQEDPLNGNLAF